MKKLRFLNAGFAGCILALALAGAVSAQDFSLTLQPDTLTLIPNEEASFVVSMAPLNGFTNPVTLSTGVLPAGVTAQFTPQTVTLPGTSLLSLRAATNAALGSFTLNITAIGGGITNTTSSSVTVDFGLVPVCTGAFTGQVTDAATGLPVTNASVSVNSYFTAQVNSNGIYTITNVTLGNNNSATLCDLEAGAPGYWISAEAEGYAVCDATNTVNLQIVFEEFSSISGTVSILGGGPAAGVRVTTSENGNFLGATTDSNGNYQFTGLSLSYDNGYSIYGVQTTPAGYWQAQSNAVVQANSNTVVDLVITPMCYGTVTGAVFYGDTRLPVNHAGVSLYDATGQLSDFSDTNGNYIFTNVVLNESGTLSNIFIGAVVAGYNGASVSATIPNCGATATAPPIYLPPIPKDNYGSVAGHVYDVQTGLPITNATIISDNGRALTDTNGAYLITNLYVGAGAVTNGLTQISANDAGYFGTQSNVEVYANQTVTQNFTLLRYGYGGVTGVVRDSVTGLPLTNIVVTISTPGSGVAPKTDVNGHYSSGPLLLYYPNVPTPASVTVSLPGYYPIFTNTTITLDATNVVDISILKVCTGATIIGNVVNALTQQPITNAYLTTGGPYPASTDTNGNFILTNVTVGNLNSPVQVTVNVSAPGFFAQSKTVTIFCNATIITDFGAPPTALGTIAGLVTNDLTGLPLAGAFIGSQFGESTLTDSNGFYQLTQAPLGANNSSRTWNITAIPTNFNAQTLPVTVSTNGIAILNFGFGSPPTALIVKAAGAPDPVTVGNELVYLVTLTNTVANASNVQLSDTLPSSVTFVSAVITNSPGTPFGAPVNSNNVITTTATDFGSNSVVTLAITVTPTVAGTLTNVATVSSATPDLDSTGSNHTATVLTTVVAPEPPTALIVTLQATPAAVLVGSNLLYTVTLTNTPANAANVQLVDTLPPSVEFVSASVSNSPGGTFGQPAFSAGAVTISAGSFASNSAVVLLITVTPSKAGFLTNAATVTTTTTNLAAGTVLSASVITTAVAPEAPTALIVTLLSTPPTVPVGSNLLYTVTLTNTIANAANVQLVDTLPPLVDFVGASVSNSLGGTFSNPVFSAGTVTISAGSFASNSAVVLFITVTPTVPGSLTNVVNVTSSTTNLAAGTTLSASATNAATAEADLALILSENSNSIVLGGNISYTIVVTNLGPANAPDVVLNDTQPVGSAEVNFTTSQGIGVPSLGGVRWDFGALSSHSFATATLVVTPAAAGNITNIGVVTLVPLGVAVVDPNLANNSASLVAKVTPPVMTNVPPTNLKIQGGPITFNPQTGLYQQSVLVTNFTVAVTAVRLAVLGLPSSVTLYNKTGLTNGTPYVEYDQAIAAGGGVAFLLEYYDATRQNFISTNFVVTSVAAATTPTPNGTTLQVDRAAFISEGQLTIEFDSIPGHTYVVEYSSDMESWQTATPPIVAKNTRTQWIDSGPPTTQSLPGALGQRFYRIVQTN